MSRGSLIRRRGERVKIYKSKPSTDARGDETYAPAGEPLEVRAVVTADRSARAEVPGQMDIDVVKMVTSADLEGVDLWSRAEWGDEWWDIVAPPARRIGTRGTRHWTLTLRRRPDNGGIPDPGGWGV